MDRSESPAAGPSAPPARAPAPMVPSAPAFVPTPAPVAPEPAPEGATESNSSTGKLSSFRFSITVPNLRNGSLVNIEQAAPKASMSALYHWPVITGLSSDLYVEAVEQLIRAAYAQFVQVLGGTATAAQHADFRKKAIVLGSIRAGAASAFRLTANDLLRAELVSSGMEYDAGRKAIVQSAGGTTSTTRWTVAQSMAKLDEDEQSVVATCVYMGMAVPALQGVSLVMTGHHYIPTTYNLFKGLKKQSLANLGQNAKTWVESMGEDFDDMAFHKSCHTISPNLKRSLSKMGALALRLRAAGHGAAAIRLPAVPSEASGGKAACALIRSAASTVTHMGVAISGEKGEVLLRNLDDAAEGNAEAEACNKVVEWVDENQQRLAFCAGVVQQVHESSGTGKNTILAAYSIRRIMADNPAEVNRGAIFARAAASKQREMMEKGEFVNISLMM